MYNDGVGDYRAVYRDGTWVAVDEGADGGYYDEDDEWSQYEDEVDPQAAYYKSLLGRYKALRSTLANADSRDLAALVEADPDKYANVRVPYHKSDWRYAFDNRHPTPALVAQIDDRVLYRALEYVSDVLIIGDTISKQKSCWIWTLLASVGESGTLDYYKVGRIRELGHKAGQLSIRLRSGEWRDNPRDEEEVDAEDWEVEGDVNAEDEAEEEAEEDEQDEIEAGGEPQAQNARSAPKEQLQDVEDGEVDEDEEDYEPPMVISGQFDGTTEQHSPARPVQPANERHNDDDVSGSEDEGEIIDDDPHEEDTPAALEAARARLLAQLGDNLVTESIPDRKIPAHQLKGKQQAHWDEPRKRGRHRHNGKVCRDSSCQMNKARQDAHRRAALRAAQSGKTKGNNPAAPSESKQGTKPAEDPQRHDAQSEQPAFVSSEADRQAEDDVFVAAVAVHTHNMLPAAAYVAAEDNSSTPPPKKRLNSSHEDAVAEARSQAAGLPEDTDPVTFLDSLDPELRRAVLMDQDEDLLAQLPIEIAAEARAYARCDDGEHGAEQRLFDAKEQPSGGEESEGEYEQDVDLNTRVTIDMILTVVGECYGQRDLLKFRETW
jgi:hypothetical protein